MLPVCEDINIVSLGEGMTPILSLKRTADKYGLSQLYLKDEGQNPTGSFKARGLSAAVSKAKEFGVDTCIIPTAGNAGGALAAYCAGWNECYCGHAPSYPKSV
jgi:threonine synthase